MQTAFMIIVLGFIRDWYQKSAMEFSGKLRDEYKERSRSIQAAIDEIKNWMQPLP